MTSLVINSDFRILANIEDTVIMQFPRAVGNWISNVLTVAEPNENEYEKISKAESADLRLRMADNAPNISMEDMIKKYGL